MRTRVYVADWDKDGRRDVVLGKGHRIMLPDGPFESRDTTTTKPNVADWNGDGQPELLVNISKRDEDGIYLLRRERNTEGPRRLAAPQRLLPTPDGARFSGLDVADWDGDGVLDLIVGLTRAERVEGKGSRGKWKSQVWVYRRIRSK